MMARAATAPPSGPGRPPRADAVAQGGHGERDADDAGGRDHDLRGPALHRVRDQARGLARVTQAALAGGRVGAAALITTAGTGRPRGARARRAPARPGAVAGEDARRRARRSATRSARSRPPLDAAGHWPRRGSRGARSRSTLDLLPRTAADGAVRFSPSRSRSAHARARAGRRGDEAARVRVVVAMPSPKVARSWRYRLRASAGRRRRPALKSWTALRPSLPAQ